MKGAFYAGVLSLLALIVAVAVATAYLPSYGDLTKRSDLGQMIRVRAANGQVLVSMGPSFGQWLPYDQIPAEMRAAMISTEDRRFRSHIGVDPIGIGRALAAAFASGHRIRATSTITQQLARNIFLTNNRSFARKFKEAILAMALERKFSKDQILELYLNRVYFGGGAYGIDAASRKFFGHGANHLSLGEAAIIAGLVKAPSNYSPSADVEAARSRSGVVLQTMVRNGFITADTAASVNPAEVRIQQTTSQNSVRYFTDWALPQLDTLIDQTASRSMSGPRSTRECRLPPTRRSAPTRRMGRKARWSQSTATARFGRWSAARTMSHRSTTARPRPSASQARRSSCSFTYRRSNRG